MDCNAQEVWSAKGFRCCNENLSPTNCSDNQSPTGRRSSTIICRPPNSSENHPKKVVVGVRREVVDVILWQPIADWSAIIDKHLPTSDNLGNHPEKIGCQRSATGCRYSVTVALLNTIILRKSFLTCMSLNCSLLFMHWDIIMCLVSNERRQNARDNEAYSLFQYCVAMKISYW